MKEVGFDRHISFNESVLRIAFGSSKTLLSFDTMQFDLTSLKKNPISSKGPLPAELIFQAGLNLALFFSDSVDFFLF